PPPTPARSWSTCSPRADTRTRRPGRGCFGRFSKGWLPRRSFSLAVSRHSRRGHSRRRYRSPWCSSSWSFPMSKHCDSTCTWPNGRSSRSSWRSSPRRSPTPRRRRSSWTTGSTTGSRGPGTSSPAPNGADGGSKPLAEDHRAVRIEEDPVLRVPAHRTGEHPPLDILPELHELTGVIGVGHPLDVLLDDRALIEVRGRIVGGRADEFHPAGVGLVVRAGPLERGEERVVDIDHPPMQG